MKLNSNNCRSLLAVLAFTTLLAACSSGHDKEGRTAEKLPTADVRAVEATIGTPPRQVEIMGTVIASHSASIAAKISGNITELPVNPGSKVREGDILVVISAGEISAKLLQAQAQFEQADRNLNREKNLLKKNAATPETVKTLEESRRIAEAAYNEAKTMLSYTRIEAPFDGVITRKNANVGDLATPGTPLLQLENNESLQVLADIPEAMVLDIKIGDSLPVYIPAADIRTSGTVAEIAPSADPRSRTAPVKLDIDNNQKIRAGQFTRISLPGKKGEAVMVPASAVLPFGQMQRVFVADDSRARLQLVKTGLRFDDQVEILAGIDSGEKVITEGHQHLRDGQPIHVL